jgi:IS5 family transposase
VNTGTIVDASIIQAPSSTKNAAQARDPEMCQTKKGNQWYFGMKAHVGVDSKSKLIHAVVCHLRPGEPVHRAASLTAGLTGGTLSAASVHRATTTSNRPIRGQNGITTRSPRSASRRSSAKGARNSLVQTFPSRSPGRSSG